MQANSLVLGGIVIGLVVAAFGDQGTIRELPVGKYLPLCLTVMPSCYGGPTPRPEISSFLIFRMVSTAIYPSAKGVSLSLYITNIVLIPLEPHFVNSSQLNGMSR